MVRVTTENLRRLKFRNQPAWVSTMVNAVNGETVGHSFTWLDGQWACTPDCHFSNDRGYSFRKTESYWLKDGTLLKELGALETDPKKIEALQELWKAYHQLAGIRLRPMGYVAASDEAEYLAVWGGSRTFRVRISATAQAQASPSPERRIKDWFDMNPLPPEGMTIRIPDYHFDPHYF